MRNRASFWNHLDKWKEAYLVLPITIILCLGFIHFISWLTGRAPTNDIQVLVDYSFLAIKASLVLMAVGFYVSHMTGDGTDEKSAWRRTCERLVVLLVFTYLFSH